MWCVVSLVCVQSPMHYHKSVILLANVRFQRIIRALVDALCRDGTGLISRERVQRGCLTRQMWIYSADRMCCCQSPFPSLQLLAALTASLVNYGVVTLRISHNEVHCRTSFSHPFCLELLFVAPTIL